MYLNVCLVSYEYPPNIFGGAGSYAKSIHHGLENEGIKVIVLTHGDASSSTQHIKKIPTPDVLYWRRLFFSHYGNKYLSKLIKKHKLDLIHYNEPHILLSKPSIPVISTFHSTQINELYIKIKLSKIIENRSLIETLIKSPVGGFGDILATHKSDRIITPSDDLKCKISKYCLYDENKIDVVCNGVKMHQIEDTQKLGEKKYLLYVGRLDPIKGVEYLIKAFIELKRENSDLGLCIVGQGYYEKYLKKISRHIEGVYFLGHINDEVRINALYHNCEMLILPSIYEAMPLVILEAMSFGKPIIASSVGGIPSIIKDGENGYLTKPRDHMDIKNKINMVLNDEEVKQKIFYNNKKKIFEKYSINAMIKNTIKSYEKTLG